ncbi:MAG: immunoglobulin domain-containing protein, partial [Verrucomicrobia bacterium]|nr:immunoglobulin domain-containing protein [Verrucomicrobiota bacterium]
ASNVVAIAAGAYHNLALRADGTVVSWGTNGFGLATVPPTATNVVGIAAGWNHSLALLGNGAPVITVQPFSRTVAHGEAVSLTVLAVGAQPLTYQWQLNGTNIAGATSNSYTRANTLFGDTGAYSVLVSNAVGSVTSSEAHLIVAAPSRPALTNPRLTGTTFTLSLSSQIGFNYVLEFKNSLNEGNWTVVQTVGGTGGTIDLQDTGATGLSRLYRVRVQ